MSTFSTQRLVVFALAFAFAASATLGCSSVGPRKYVLFGPPQPQQVEAFEDYWTDEVGIFKPNDSSLPLRRGKGAVVRFFKKGNYTKSIMVDGTFAVNVYEGRGEGISLTQPDMRLELTSEQLNDEQHRKFDKETGYTYQVWLDFGEYDQPEKTATVLSSFTDAKTDQTTLSKEIEIKIVGTTPALDDEKAEQLSEAEEWARKKLNCESDDPIGDLQAKYSARNARRRAEEEANPRTRVRESIDLSEAGIRALEAPEGRERSESLLQQAQDRRDAKLAEFLEDRREKREYYRERRRQEADDYLESDASARRFGGSDFAALRSERNASGALDFRAARPDYSGLTADVESSNAQLAGELSRRASEEYAKGPESTLRGDDGERFGSTEYDRFGETRTSALRSTGALERRRSAYADYNDDYDDRYDEPSNDSRSVRPATRVAVADRNDFAARSIDANRSNRLNRLNDSDFAPRETDVPQNSGTARFDGLDDFVPDANAPTTQVYSR